MQAHELKRKTASKQAKRVGRGGSRGKTSGRGHKGQKQHGSHGIRPEIRDQIKKIPKLRGRGKNSNKSRHPKANVFNLAFLEKHFDAGEIISPSTLMEKGLLKGAVSRKAPVKILAYGDISKKFIIEQCKLSQSAREKIEAAGGEIK